jgi:FMN-dependent NADH-azoreductase
MNILHIVCSPRGVPSASRRFSEAIVARVRSRHPDAHVMLRDLAANPLPHVDAGYALALAARTEAGLASAGDDALGRSLALIDELKRADVVVIGTPMHNYTVPSVLKAWIDHVVRIRHTFAPSPRGKVALLHDRPVYVAVAAGGTYVDEAAGQPDFLTPYLRAILGTIGLHDLTFFPLEAIAFGPDAVEAAMGRAHRALDAVLPVAETAPSAAAEGAPVA